MAHEFAQIYHTDKAKRLSDAVYLRILFYYNLDASKVLSFIIIISTGCPA